MPATVVSDGLLLQALERRQVVRFRNRSGSMVPTICPHDIVLARRESVEPGDIALTWHQERWMTHRVLKITDTQLCLQSDHDGRIDELPVESAVGRVIAVHSDLRGRLRRARGRLRRTCRRAWFDIVARIAEIE